MSDRFYKLSIDNYPNALLYTIDSYLLDGLTYGVLDSGTVGIFSFTSNLNVRGRNVSGDRNFTITVSKDGTTVKITNGSDIPIFTITIDTTPVNLVGKTFKFDFVTNPCFGNQNFTVTEKINELNRWIINDVTGQDYIQLFSSPSFGVGAFAAREDNLKTDLNNILSQSPLFLLQTAIQNLKKQISAAEADPVSLPFDIGSKTEQVQTDLDHALDYIGKCISKNLMVDGAGQIGDFYHALTDGLDQSYSANANTANKAILDAKRKAAASSLASIAPSGLSAETSVNPSISDLEKAQSRAQADNRIIFNTQSSGVNIFTNPAGDPTNVYTILDIMRDEQSGFVFESTATTMTTVPNSAQPAGNQCQAVLAKLNPAQIKALIKTIIDQQAYNTSLMVKLQLLINRIGNQMTLGSLSAWWAGIKIPSLSLGTDTSNQQVAIKALRKAATLGLSNLSVANGKSWSKFQVNQLLNAGSKIDNAWNSLTSQIGTAQLLANIKANSAAMADIFKHLSPSDKEMCSILNDLASAANNPALLKSTEAKLTTTAMADLQKLKQLAEKAQTIADGQKSLAAIQTMLTTVLKSK